MDGDDEQASRLASGTKCFSPPSSQGAPLSADHMPSELMKDVQYFEEVRSCRHARDFVTYTLMMMHTGGLDSTRSPSPFLHGRACALLGAAGALRTAGTDLPVLSGAFVHGLPSINRPAYSSQRISYRSYPLVTKRGGQRIPTLKRWRACLSFGMRPLNEPCISETGSVDLSYVQFSELISPSPWKNTKC